MQGLNTGGYSINLDELKLDKNLRILITGCAGFIGSNLLEFLLKKNIYVRGLDNFSTGSMPNIDSALSEVSKINKKIEFELFEGDIRDIDTCIKSTKDIDIVLHHAAVGSVQRSIEDPLLSSSVNVNGTLNILKAALDNNVKKLIFSSSSSVYGDTPTLPKVEEICPSPKSIYAVSKLAGEYYCRLFYDIYGFKTITLRYFNVFGKRQNANSIYAAVIPKFLDSIKRNKNPVIYGDGCQSRDFTYIDNVLYANYLAIISENKNTFGNFYNIACNSRVSLNEIINLLAKYLKKSIIPDYCNERKGDVKHSLASIEKIKKGLNYTPIVDFNDGIQKYISYF